MLRLYCLTAQLFQRLTDGSRSKVNPRLLNGEPRYVNAVQISGADSANFNELSPRMKHDWPRSACVS